mgnify:CR=1 FL=1
MPQGEDGSESLNNLRTAVQSYEKSHIENVLKETAGDKTRAAELLGVSRSSLYRKMESLGIHNNVAKRRNCLGANPCVNFDSRRSWRRVLTRLSIIQHLSNTSLRRVGDLPA